MDLDALIDQIMNGALKPVEAARQIIVLEEWKRHEDKKLKEMYQLSREILHYDEQLASAPTSQWQASFHFEKMQSEKALARIAKQVAKKRAG